MHNPFQTKGAAHYAEGCGPSYPNLSQESLSKVSVEDKKDASTTVTEVQPTSQYPAGWPPETIESIERAKAARQQIGGEGKNGKPGAEVKGTKRVVAAAETVALGVAVGIARLL